MRGANITESLEPEEVRRDLESPHLERALETAAVIHVHDAPGDDENLDLLRRIVARAGCRAAAAITVSSSCAGMIAVTLGVTSALRTSRARILASSAAATG